MTVALSTATLLVKFLGSGLCGSILLFAVYLSMDIAANTFTSAFLQRRDKAAEEKHQKEVSVYLRRIERLRLSYDAAQKEIFDVTARADRLALSLGFNNFHEAQVAIDTADHELSYKDCLERVEELENRLSAEEAKNYALQEQIRVLEEERKQLHVAAERSLSDARCVSII